MTRVQDLMTPHVVAVPRDACLRRVAEILEDHGISGAPVVDEAGVVLGVISRSDLGRALARGGPGPELLLLEPEAEIPGVSWELEQGDEDPPWDLVAELVAEDVMSPEPLSVPASAPAREAARRMRAAGVRRLLVSNGQDEVAGIVSASDLLALLAGEPARRRAA